MEESYSNKNSKKGYYHILILQISLQYLFTHALLSKKSETLKVSQTYFKIRKIPTGLDH